VTGPVRAVGVATCLCCLVELAAQAPPPVERVSRFALRSGGPELQRPARSGAFFDVVGRRAALFGYENRDAEAWVYPLKVLDALSLSFRLEGYPLEIDGRDIMAGIHVRPEATTLVYAHAAFTVRQVMFAPLDEPGIVILLDVQSTLPIAITASFRPRLRLMWPATSMTASIGWDPATHVYYLTEETRRFAAVLGCPLGRDESVMPYQEEPRDAPNRLVIDVGSDAQRDFVPIVIAGSVDGRDAAKASYDRILGSVHALYDRTGDHFQRVDADTLSLTTPDPQLDAAFRWAKIGVDKGLATNPQLGTGLLAGFRTSGDSERPGYAWFFGRDALWTSLATTSEGDFETTRTALEFLRKYQRQDGKIPHEISQSAALVPWFDQYPYAWASADATPLYVIAHGDYWRASGDRAFLQQAWDSIVKAYRFSAATDSDGNGLIENTNAGHGWVEGGALYPPHEEMYLEGLWVAASRGIAELADVMQDAALARQARDAADRARAAIERTYWIDRPPERLALSSAGGFYAFATARPHTRAAAEPGPNRERRQRRLQALDAASLIDEDTVLPAVPLWFDAVSEEHAQLELDRIGSGTIATDWGSRILSNRSELYDPLSYHYGSVWPLFTGWASVAAYRHGRPSIGYQGLMANALLTDAGALGEVTELLSGDFATAFGRSSHHQVWSEAMVVTPVVRGLLGIEVADAGRTLRFAPSLPATWNRVEVRGVRAGADRVDFTLERGAGRTSVRVVAGAPRDQHHIVVAPAFPLDARVRRVTVNGAATNPQATTVGDVQRVAVTIDRPSPTVEVVFTVDEGTEIYAEPQPILPGADNHGLRLLRVRPDAGALRLVVEGRGGRAYAIVVRTPRRLGPADGVNAMPSSDGLQRLQIRFEGAATDYVRREIEIPFAR
jgi:glycogen debranching enzyme